MAMIGGYVYMYITKDTTAIEFFGIPLPSLSIAIWVLVPLFILYIASVLHMLFYSLLGSFKLSKYEQDYGQIIEAIAESFLGKKDENRLFKTERYQLLGTLLENTTLIPTSKLIGLTKSDKIDNILGDIEKLKNGEVVELKQYNLPMDNEFFIQNERNRYKAGEITAEDILLNSTKYAEVFKKEIYVDYVKKASLVNMIKYKPLLTKEAFYNILNRINAEIFSLEISNEEIVSFIELLDFTKEDFIQLSTMTSLSHMIPDQRMKLFEILGDSYEEAIEAYLYTLFDLEMIAPAIEILENSQADEYLKFKAYNTLKENNKNFSIKLFI